MKVLLVGGAGQGKLEYALCAYGLDAGEVLDCAGSVPAECLSARGIYRLHALVKRLLEQGEDPLEYVLERLTGREDWVIVCDEIGCGVVPVKGRERAWREQTGRLCCALAERADFVERVCCGLPLRLKG